MKLKRLAALLLAGLLTAASFSALAAKKNEKKNPTCDRVPFG